MQLNYKAYGKGHPLIILHGLLGSLDNWHSIARKLASDYRVFLVDQRNHGKSPHTDEMSYSAMAEDLKEFLQEHGLASAYVVGHSMGGKTAMQFALSYPEKVDKLISIDMDPQANDGGHETIFNALKAMDLDQIEKRSDADKQLQQYIENFGIRQFLLKNMERGPEGGYQWKMNLPAIEKAYPHILEAVTSETPFQKPTLFLKGGASNYIRDKDLPVIQNLFPKASLKTVEGVGHWVHAEAPEAFINALEGFLADNNF